MNTVPTERTTGVWISATLATVLRLGPDGLVSREEIDSLVAGRHRSTGVRRRRAICRAEVEAPE
jgi:hypothetical protein